MQIGKIIFLVLLFGLVACGDIKNTRLMPSELTYEEVEQSSEGIPVSYNPQLDILFVLDNSKSMTEEIKYLKSNISSFVDEFANNSVIDYHIGVTYVYDSIRYNNKVVSKKHPITGQVQYLEPGELIGLDGVKFIDRSHSKKDLEKLFDVKSAPNYVKTVNGDEFNYVSETKVMQNKEGEAKKDENGNPVYQSIAIGPENEESFTAVRAAFSASSLAGYNKGFYRPNSHTVIVFVTDAEDASSISAKKLFQELFEFKARNMNLLSAYGVLCESADKRCLNLKSDGKSTIEIDSTKIKEFVSLVNTKKYESGAAIDIEINPILNLRSNNWGKKLARIGVQIRKQTLEKHIQLAYTPEYDQVNEKPMIKVYYGDHELPYDNQVGWSYRANKNERNRMGGTVIIHGGIDPENYDLDTKIRIEYKKVQYKELSKPVRSD